MNALFNKIQTLRILETLRASWIRMSKQVLEL